MLALSVLPLVALALLSSVSGVPVDNGLEGKVEIACGPETVKVAFNTANNFEGHVYVKGRFEDPDCRNSEGGRRYTALELGFGDCGLRRERSLNPKGVFIYFNLILTFHPLFVTKVDRAFRIQCFYMEADKTVDTGLEVSMLTTNFQTDMVPMPICRYEVLDGGPTGPLVEFAQIGQPVYHKWTCDTESVDTFCMIVYGCFVDDTNGDRVEILDGDGCALDRNILDNVEYQSDLMSGQEAHVFKFADRPQLYFNCQIRILVKNPLEVCPRPVCSEPPTSLGRRKREIFDIDGFTLDVSSQDVEVVDLHVNGSRSQVGAQDSQRICFEHMSFGFVLVSSVLLSSFVTALATFACLKASL